jgi:hypothetical protein
VDFFYQAGLTRTEVRAALPHILAQRTHQRDTELAQLRAVASALRAELRCVEQAAVREERRCPTGRTKFVIIDESTFIGSSGTIEYTIGTADNGTAGRRPKLEVVYN